ncbi:MAG: HAD family hydrolase, partial [Leptotrichiaceae bacterium]|nr:HAD family hydrolase [Leptotrichiaceae bacterium]
MGKNRFILLDRDGVVNVEKSYLYKIEDFEYEKGVVESLKRLSEKGFKFAIITNQAGIAKGYYTEDDFFKLEKYIEKDLYEKGIKIEKTYFCPHHPEAEGKYGIKCKCRKPAMGNFLKAAEEFDINVKKSYMIGDRISDLLPAENLGINTVLVRTGYGKENERKIEDLKQKPIIVNNISEFADYIEN